MKFGEIQLHGNKQTERHISANFYFVGAEEYLMYWTREENLEHKVQRQKDEAFVRHIDGCENHILFKGKRCKVVQDSAQNLI